MTTCPQNVWNHLNGCTCVRPVSAASDTPSAFGSYNATPVQLPDFRDPAQRREFVELREELPQETIDAAINEVKGRGMDAEYLLMRLAPYTSSAALISAMREHPNLVSYVWTGVRDQDTDIDSGVIDEVARHGDVDIRDDIASRHRRDVSPDTLERLSKDRSKRVRESVAGNPLTPRDVLRKMSEDEGDIGAAAAGNRSLPADRIAEIATAEYGAHRPHAMLNPSLPHDAMEWIMDNGDHVASNVAANRGLPEHLQIKAIDQGFSPARLAENWSLTPVAAERLMDVAGSDTQVAERLASQTWRDDLSPLSQRLANDERSSVRVAVAGSTLDPEVIQRLANDDDLHVRRQVCYNAATPTALVEQIAQSDPDDGVRSSAMSELNAQRVKSPVVV